MSFLRPHTISISRPTADETAGVGEYSGLAQQSEVSIAEGLPANIYLNRTGRASDADLPSDALLRAMYRIVFHGPSSLVRTRDVITDQNGTRYQVTAPYWSSMGWSCLCERLEV